MPEQQQAEPTTQPEPTSKTFTQEQVNTLLADQKRKAAERFADYDDLKAAKSRLDELETANQTELQKLQARAEKAERELTDGRLRLASERVATAVDRALDGRSVPPSALINLDKAQFIKGEGADVDAITAWAQQFPEARITRPATTFGLGPRENVQPRRGERGAAEAARRFGTK